MNPVVSIIMPSYNSKKYISAAIDSVIQQSFDSWELIIIDDGSEDGTLNIIDNYRKNDQRIKLLNQRHRGAASARNLGINNAKGEYLAFLDSDDFYDLDFLYKGLNKMKNEKSQCVVFNTFFFINDKCLNIDVSGVGMFNSNPAIWNKIYKKELWGNLRFPDDMIIEDYEITPALIGKAKKVSKVDDSFYHYRQHEQSLTHNIKNSYQETEIVRATKLLVRNLADNNISLSSHEKEKMCAYVNHQIYAHLMKGIKYSISRKKSREIFNIISRYSFQFNSDEYGHKRTIYHKRKLIQLRNDIVIISFRLGLFKFGTKIGDLRNHY
ncbi:glycosyltransferase family 2 protein [Limosilactobacillus vaginalis]|uniref:glycosyltransferase family 2 protein n=1 Tax=Limosilactobacillus vaginalis TaxID=1633 RepID=UPI0025A415B6|nr:glycosyltransferase family 2 protein [Limosilactobacillus vaginalis]MDM8222236.1 glycosyltransferase family 2 protein [Limosilactobacillus vaginalis]MDM8264759.1 glycosyltransferase family 2 protein [Limosilactobacillus vaginalis]